jgi:RNA-directed DNA polymerase
VFKIEIFIQKEYPAGVLKVLYKVIKMEIEQTYIAQIRKQFSELQSKEDLVKLLSGAKSILYGEECKPVQLKSLTYYANPEICKKRYQTFTIKKKSGADRTIHAPVKGLKSILRSLNFVLQCMYEPHEAATGFVMGRSIVDNAKKHVGHHYVLNLDLKDFFHSFDRNRVKMVFMYEPFYLNGDKEPLAFLLASLCTHPFEIREEIKTVLPQGSPTSPTLTNILCKKLDRRLNGLANRFGATFTRYADDITFSSPHNLYTDKAFNQELKRIIEEDQKLVINPKKTRLQKAGYRQEVTGLIVNEKVNVRRRYVKQIRMWLYYWENYGHEKAERIFKRDYIADKGHTKNINAHLINVLDGKLEFLKMVKGTEDGTYQGLNKRFDILTRTPNPINKLLDTWENGGIAKAMDLYYQDNTE